MPHPSRPRALPTALLTAVLALALVGCASAANPDAQRPTATTTARTAATARPPIRHVFVLVLENKDAAETFGAHSPAPYLARTLKRRGAFVPNYYGIAHLSLSNYVALVSGQAPTPANQLDCPTFTDVQPATPAADGQVIGDGCVYPRSVQTIADQLEHSGRTWKAYNEDLGNDPARDGGTSCGHPPIGAVDRARAATATSQYATRHNPFVYFHSIIDRSACAKRDVSLAPLSRDLKRTSTTANLSFITPDLCHDGHDATCADGGPGGGEGIDVFLRRWVPRITGSPAYKRDGLLAIVFDEAEDDAHACCGEPTGPNTTQPGLNGAGGGRTGAVLMSPFIRPGTQTSKAYNHYSLLRSMEDLFHLPHLGYAARPGLRPLGADVYTRAKAKR